MLCFKPARSLARILCAALMLTLASFSTHAAPAAGASTTWSIAWPILRLPDMTADVIGTTLLFRVRNLGNAASPATVTRVECFTNAASQTGDPCLPDVHYVVIPNVVLPPGTSMSAPNVWNVPIGGLDAGGGYTTFGLNIRSAPGVTNGLKFRVCADATGLLAEWSEANNCTTIVHDWP